MTHPLFLRSLSEKNPYGIFMWLYVTSRGYMLQSVVIRLFVLLMRQHLTRKKPRGGYVSTTVVIRLISCLYVVIYCICTEKVPEPSDDGLSGYTTKAVVIRPPVRGYTTPCSPDASAGY